MNLLQKVKFLYEDYNQMLTSHKRSQLCALKKECSRTQFNYRRFINQITPLANLRKKQAVLNQKIPKILQVFFQITQPKYFFKSIDAIEGSLLKPKVQKRVSIFQFYSRNFSLMIVEICCTHANSKTVSLQNSSIKTQINS